MTSTGHPGQGVLFAREGLIAAPRARRGGPSTSVEAALAAKSLAAVHARLVLSALRRGVATAEQLADERLGGMLSPLQTMKRLSELLRAGLVHIVDENGRTKSGRACRRYCLSETRP